MRLLDVNVLVYAYREDAPNHSGYKNWVEKMVNAPEAFGVSDLVLSSFLRVVTHPRVFDPPSPIQHALSFIEEIRRAPNCVTVSPGDRHWSIFVDLCRSSGVRGNLVPDAYLAALAIETGSEWITADRDYVRFKGLKWRHPLEDALQR